MLTEAEDRDGGGGIWLSEVEVTSNLCEGCVFDVGFRAPSDSFIAEEKPEVNRFGDATGSALDVSACLISDFGS